MMHLSLIRARARATWWGARALRSAARSLEREGLDRVAIPPVPNLPREAYPGVRLSMRASRSCLARAMVRQAWEAAHGRRRDVVIGVRQSGERFKAHAWLEGDPPQVAEGFRELARRPAR